MPDWADGFAPREARTYDVAVAEDFSSAEVRDIWAAAETWRQAVPELTLIVVPTCDPDHAPPRHHTICLIHGASNDPNILAYTHWRRTDEGARYAEVVLRPDASVPTIAHEIAHGMGVEHTRHRGTLMFPYAKGALGQRCDADAPTADDVTAWRAVRR